MVKQAYTQKHNVNDCADWAYPGGSRQIRPGHPKPFNTALLPPLTSTPPPCSSQVPIIRRRRGALAEIHDRQVTLVPSSSSINSGRGDLPAINKAWEPGGQSNGSRAVSGYCDIMRLLGYYNVRGTKPGDWRRNPEPLVPCQVHSSPSSYILLLCVLCRRTL